MTDNDASVDKKAVPDPDFPLGYAFRESLILFLPPSNPSSCRCSLGGSILLSPLLRRNQRRHPHNAHIAFIRRRCSQRCDLIHLRNGVVVGRRLGLLRSEF